MKINFPIITKTEMLLIPANEISDQKRIPQGPLLSVVMMTFNHESFITQAVESVIEQQCGFPIELLIGEDFSTDGTRAVCEKLQKQYPSLIRLIVASENVGITNNFLRLMSRANGKYIAMLEGDDYWIHPEKLNMQVTMLETHDDYSWCGAKTLNRTFWAKVKDYYTITDVISHYLVHTSTIMFRSKLLNIFPRFNDVECLDTLLYTYLSEHGKCGFINKEVSFYRRHKGGVWGGASTEDRIKYTCKITQALDDYFGGKYTQTLFERELWIHKMETTVHLEKNLFFKQWLQSLYIVRLSFSRTIKILPYQYLLFAIKVCLQPFTAAYLAFRRKLAIRNRLDSLKENILYNKYRF